MYFNFKVINCKFSLAFSTCLFATSSNMWVEGIIAESCQGRTVGVVVRTPWGLSGASSAKSTCLLTSCCDLRIVRISAVLSHLCAIIVLVYTWLWCCQWSISACRSIWSTFYDYNGASNTTHTNSSLQPYESLLTPIFSPTVLNEPVFFSIFTSISNNSDCVVDFGTAGTSSKNTSCILLKWSIGCDTSYYRAIL